MLRFWTILFVAGLCCVTAPTAQAILVFSGPSGLSAEAEFTMLDPTTLEIRLRNTSTGVPDGFDEAMQLLTTISWDFGQVGVHSDDPQIIGGTVVIGPTSQSVNFNVNGPSSPQDFGPGTDLSGEYGFGNERAMPAGPLREDVARGLRRADAVVLLGPDASHLAGRLSRAGPVLLRANLEPTPECRRFAGKPVVAFAGIGRPEKVFATLAGMGCRVLGRHAFPDHHRYGPDEIMKLVEEANERGAALVTTEKDFVRLSREAWPMVEVLSVRLTWADPQALDRLLAPLFAAA